MSDDKSDTTETVETTPDGREINRAVVDFDKATPDELWLGTAPLRAYFRPKFFGLENVAADRPALLVGNHTIYGMLDIPIFTAQIYRERGVLLRGLSDHLHFEIPGWRDLLVRGGGVEGTRPNCRALMEAGEHVLVFPGGGREVAKRKGEAYKLLWKQRLGFTRMAIEHGYPILPFASVGPEDAFDILVDGDEILESPVGRFLQRAGMDEKLLRDGGVMVPIARGLGLTALPRPERFYFKIGEPIDTRAYKGRENDEDALWELRNKTAIAVNTAIEELMAEREKDDKAGLLPRLFSFRRRHNM